MTLNSSQVIEEMLREDTGRHMLDSGGSSGRMWQRNQKRDLKGEPEVKLSFDPKYKEINITMSLFHALDDSLNFDNDWQRLFDEFSDTEEEKGNPWTETLNNFFKVDQGAYKAAERCLEKYKDDEKFVEWLTNFRKQMADGCKFEVEYGGYTYNEETSIDQDFCYWKFEFDGDDFTIIQSHNGADARGGFSSPKFFSSGLDELLSNISYDNAYVRCEGYDSHQLLFNGKEEGRIEHCWQGYKLESESYPHDAKGLYEYDMEFGEEFKKGIIVVKASGRAICPECPSELY